MPTPYHRFNPLTKAVLAATVTLGAFAAGGYSVPLGLVALVVGPSAIAARVTARLVRIAVAVSAPITVSVALVSVFTRAGHTVLFSVGPFDATGEGLDFAGQVLARMFAAAMALGLFSLTTDPRTLIADIERRGLPPRLAFAAAATLQTIPMLVERARVIRDAQRARGLDTEGSLGARVAGVLPLAGPLVLSALTDVEERSLALEVRGFGRPGRRRLLWTVPDSARQRALRWACLLALAAFLVGRATGLLAGIP
jgi:energy-coupling factor transport system permease protein